jgi:hypothetical protein
MKNKPPEQICQDERCPGYKKWLKRIMKRLRRRQEKQDPENAMKKNKYQGYST